MYANRVIESLLKLEKHRKLTQFREIIGRIDLGGARKDIADSVKFNLGCGNNIADASGYVIPSGYGNLMTIPTEARQPYGLCWFDYDYDPRRKFTVNHKFKEEQFAIEPTARGVLARGGSDGQMVMVVFSRLHHLKGLIGFEVWLPSPVVWFTRSSPEYGRILVSSMISGTTALKNPDEVAGGDVVDIEVALSAMMLLNCKNIITETVSPPAKVNKKRDKFGKTPIFDYHILKVKVPKSRSCGNGAGGDEAQNRVHLCRGHFKRFTEERPLMGKHTGMYWWQPHVRGSKNAGTVHKDYSVEVEK